MRTPLEMLFGQELRVSIANNGLWDSPVMEEEIIQQPVCPILGSIASTAEGNADLFGELVYAD